MLGSVFAIAAGKPPPRTDKANEGNTAELAFLISGEYDNKDKFRRQLGPGDTGPGA